MLRTAPVSGGPEGAAWCTEFAYRKRLDGGYTIADGSQNRHDIRADSFRYFPDFMPMMRQEWGSFSLGLTPWPVTDQNGETPFERTRTLDPAPVENRLSATYAAFIKAFPIFRDVAVEQSWAGMIDATPDAIPVISTVNSLPGLVIATGFSGHGFGIARLGAEDKDRLVHTTSQTRHGVQAMRQSAAHRPIARGRLYHLMQRSRTGEPVRGHARRGSGHRA